MRALQDEITEFLKERNWLDQYQHPKELALSLTLEASELLECFQWRTSEEAITKEREHILEETADVLIYALQIIESLGEDAEKVVQRKLAKNKARNWK
ncbi:nucleotide pyrophosphohydrolase [Listeria sp. PSOL-1]|uniref:nucleotide pyrophosphohydrolase n=1 Tax=Listeria sp. PSOL-1 TaxID=1844999 RepID=UPI0013D587C5|nr:nucleotide pyrophosphohydrolase [Listeria sp. PSOL-1]